MKNIVAFLLLTFLTLNLFSAAAIKRIWLRSPSTITFEGATEDANQTVISAIDPTQANAILIQDSSGTFAFLSDIEGVIFPPTGAIFVNAANTGDPEEDGSFENPFDLISEGLDASVAGNLINIAPGNYPEAMVVPHDLFVTGQLVTGLLSVDISSGELSGLLGHLRYYTGGVLIYPVGNSVASGNDFDFAWQVGLTTSSAFEIGLLPSPLTYDVGSRTYAIGATANASNISVLGIGANKPHITTSDDSLFRDTIDNHFTNLELTSALNVIFNSGAFASTTNLEHVVFNGTVMISQGSFTHSGHVQSVTVVGANNYTANGTVNSGDIEDLIVGGTVGLKNYSGNAHIRKAQRMGTSGTMSGNIVHDDGIIEFSGDITGSVSGIRSNGRMVGQGANAILVNLSDSDFTALGTVLTNQIFKSTSIFTNCKADYFFRGNTIIELGVLYERVTHKSLSVSDTTVENKGNFIYNQFIHDGATSDRTGFAVSTGAHLHNSIFEDYAGKIAIRGREMLDNNVGFQGYGSASLLAKFFTSTNTVVFPLNAIPEESDGAGTGTKSSMVGNVFDARIISINDQSGSPTLEALSNLNGNVFEFIVFEDVDTTPADGISDTFLYATTTGVSVFVIHSTATDAATIDSLLNSPGDLTSATAISYMAQAATIVLTETELGGGLIGPEITILGTVASLEITADDTAVDMSASPTIRLSSDNVTASNRTITVDEGKLINTETYRFVFVDASDAIEWIDGGASSPFLNGNWTPSVGQSISFIYDGIDLIEVGRSNN